MKEMIEQYPALQLSRMTCRAAGIPFCIFIGRDTDLKCVMELVRKVPPLNSQVMLLGKTGLGKEASG